MPETPPNRPKMAEADECPKCHEKSFNVRGRFEGRSGAMDRAPGVREVRGYLPSSRQIKLRRTGDNEP